MVPTISCLLALGSINCVVLWTNGNRVGRIHHVSVERSNVAPHAVRDDISATTTTERNNMPNKEETLSNVVCGGCGFEHALLYPNIKKIWCPNCGVEDRS